MCLSKISVFFEVDIVVLESQLICDVHFWAGIEEGVYTWDVGICTCSTIVV